MLVLIIIIMLKKEALKLPIQLFIILENSNFLVLSSSVNYLNFFFVYLSAGRLKSVASLLKNELFLSNSSLLDIIGYERKLGSRWSNILIYVFFLHFLNLKLSVITNIASSIETIARDIKGAAWLEREVGEMLGLKFLNQLDSRNLLLDYSFKPGVLSKRFSTNLNENIFFNSIEESVVYNQYYNVDL